VGRRELPRDIVKQACNELGIHLKVAEKTPLNSVPTPSAANRSGTSHTSRGADDAEGDYDWFRDVEHTGGEVEMSIEDLTVHAFERGQLDAWELKTATQADDPAKRRKIARIPPTQLTGGQLPTLEQLRTQIVTGATPTRSRSFWRTAGATSTTAPTPSSRCRTC